MTNARIDIPQAKMEAFCRKWGIVELSLFGSVLRDDFGPDSDVDVLVDFRENVKITLFDLSDMKDELEDILLKEVDLIGKSWLLNPGKRRTILYSREVVYAA